MGPINRLTQHPKGMYPTPTKNMLNEKYVHSHQNVHRPGNKTKMNYNLRNSYTMGCPPVRGDNPRASASG